MHEIMKSENIPENCIEQRPEKIKVVVADDSALMRKLIPEMLKSDERIEVVATAMDGLLALKKIEQYQPDVITLDIMMPNMDGITALRHIVSQYRIPVIIVSSLTQRGAKVTMEALEFGAVDFVTKPQKALPGDLSEMASELIAKISAVARLRGRHWREKPIPPPIQKQPLEATGIEPQKLICIGISTGGPEALSYMLPRLPRRLAAAIMVVQHMPAGFTAQLAQRLNSRCEMEVKEAEDGDLVLPGRILIAPGGRHMRIKRLPLAVTAVIEEGLPICGHCPSVDTLFTSAATEFGTRAIGVIMTGMGEDGVNGLTQIRQAGGITLAQDETSSVVFGMPRVALMRGAATEALALEQIPEYLIEKAGLL